MFGTQGTRVGGVKSVRMCGGGARTEERLTWVGRGEVGVWGGIDGEKERVFLPEGSRFGRGGKCNKKEGPPLVGGRDREVFVFINMPIFRGGGSGPKRRRKRVTRGGEKKKEKAGEGKKLIYDFFSGDVLRS